MTNGSDTELLERFRQSRDEDAFAELMRRHGGMVLRAAQTVLRDSVRAEDVVQATFLALARKAGAVCGKTLAGWLYHVALCLARNERKAAQRRRDREEVAAMASALPAAEPLLTVEVQAAMFEEIDALPETYRAPVLLHHLEGKRYQDAAAELGLNPKTFSVRLTRALELLRKRLAGRGVAVGAAAFAALIGNATAAELPASLVASTCKAVGLLAAGNLAAGGVVSAKVVTLTEGAMKMLFWAKVKTAVVAAALAMVAGGAGVTTYAALAGGQATPGTQQAAAEEPKPAKEEPNVSGVPAADAKVFDCVLNNVKVSVTKEGDTVKAITVTTTYTKAKRAGDQQDGEAVTKTHIFDVVLDDTGKRLADKDGAVVRVIVGHWVEVEGKKKLTITGLDPVEFPDPEFVARQARFQPVTLKNAKVRVTKEGGTVKAITVSHSRWSEMRPQGGQSVMTDVYDVVLDDNGKKLADKDGAVVPLIEGKWNAPKGKRTLTITGMDTDTDRF